MRRLSPILLAAVSLALPAAAEGGKLDPPDTSRYLRWGPLRVRPGIEVTNLGYDDNILVNDRERVSDYRLTLAPRVDGLLLLGRAFVTFEERLEYTAFLENTNQNHFNHLGSGKITLPFRRFGVFASYGLHDVRERPIDREDIRRERQEHRFGAGTVWQLGWRTELELARRRIHYRYRDEDDGPASSDEIDRVEEARDLQMLYKLRGRTTLSLDGSWKDLAFDRRPERDAREVSVLPGVRLGEGGPLTGTLRLGWSRVEADDPTVADLEGLVGDGALAWRLGGRTSVRLEFDRSQHFAVDSIRRYYRIGEVGTRVVHYLNRILGVEAGTRVGRLRYLGGPAGVATRVDDLLRYDAGVRLRLAENTLGRRVEYVLRVARYERDSNEAVDTRRTSWGIDAVLGF